jgi:hypothetical protein
MARRRPALVKAGLDSVENPRRALVFVDEHWRRLVHHQTRICSHSLQSRFIVKIQDGSAD